MSYSHNHNSKERRRQRFRDLQIEHAKTRGVLVQFVTRGFLSRLKWLFLGK